MSHWRLNYVSPAAGGADLGIYLHDTFKSSDQPLQQGTGVKQGDARAAIMIGPTLATNLLSTFLIGIQAWWVVNSAWVLVPFFFASSRDHRRKRDVLFNHLSRDSAAIRVEKVLAMLVESGFVYCCIWVRHLFVPFSFRNSSVGGCGWGNTQVLYLISTYRVLPDPWFAVMNASLVYFSVRKPHFHRP
jgi:hypothetical protein